MKAATVTELWRYPVKSTQGEELEAASIAERGLVGDRAFAFVDCETGNVVSAKEPRKWSALFDFRSCYVAQPDGDGLRAVRVHFPDGTSFRASDDGLDEAVSAILGRRVELAAVAPPAPQLEEYWPDIEGLDHRDAVTEEPMPERTFFDAAAVHVLTTTTLDRLGELYPDGRFDVRRFRPNVLVAAGSDGFVENDWVGRSLALGDEVVLRVEKPCPRCVMTTLAQPGLPKDPGVLRAAAQHNGANVGVYASVLRGGTVRRGDAVRLAD